MITTISVLVALFVIAVPVYAQSPIPSMPPTHQGNGGFLGEVESFFGNLFHHHNSNGGPSQDQTVQNQSVSPSADGPSGTMQSNSSGMPDSTSIQERRMSYLVQQGKITQAQADAILAELQKVQSELKTWADSEGISEQYVLGGPMGEMGQEQGGQQSFQNGSDQSGQNQQGQGMMHSQGGPGRQSGFGGGQHGQPQQQGQGL